MAKVAGNLILHGVSGQIGDQIVIRQRGVKIILSQSPVASEKEATPAQTAHRQRFQQAIVYGQHVLANADDKAAYDSKATGLRNGFNVAVADFMKAPQIDEIDVTHYRGAVGDAIRVRATDDFDVQRVTVSIHSADGALIEEGEAVQQDNVIDWIYTTTAANGDTSGDRIEVRAYDRPGNVTEADQTL